MDGAPVGSRRMLSAVSSFFARWIPIRYVPQLRFTPADIALALLFGGVGAAYSYYCFGLLDPAIYFEKNSDTWFDADQDRRLAAIHDPANARLGRTSVHPIYVLTITPIMKALVALGLAPVDAGRCIIAGCAFLSTAFLLLALRGLGLPRPVAALFSGVFLASATFVHWFAIVETYAFATVTLSFMLLVLTSASIQRGWLWLTASAATLSITVTNWMLGLSALFFRLGLRRAVTLSLAAFLIVVALTAVQKLIYPHAQLFFTPGSLLSERRALLVHPNYLDVRPWTPFANIWAVAVTSAVTPAPMISANVRNPAKRFVSNHESSLEAHTMSGWIAFVSWLSILILAAHSGWSSIERRAVFSAISLALVGQMALHSVYGIVTFLYAGNYFPTLVIFAAFSWFSPYRILAALAALAFVVFGGISNFTQFEATTHMLQTIIQER